jgi:glucose/arabinose dehydrogenase
MSRDWLNRRSFVAALGIAIAGCGSDAGEGTTGTPIDTSDAGTTGTSTDTPTIGTTGTPIDTSAAETTGSPTGTEPPGETGSPTRTEPPGETGSPTGTEPETSTPSPVPYATPPDLPQASSITSPIETDGPAINLELVATGLTSPIALVALPEGTTAVNGPARYVADQSGEIYAHDGSGLSTERVLDPPEDLVYGGEAGLIGLALHPDFVTNRRYFVRYSAESRAGTPSDYNHTAVLAEYQATEDFRGTVQGSERTVLEVPQPQGNHNAGAIAFGPEGYLYVAFGDGGSGNDQGTGHVDDWYDAVDGGNGQDITENLLGSILRIDVDGEEDGKNYDVPGDNPLVGEERFDEQYAWGLRNPWRMSFHRGNLFVADVGQGAYEEVSIVRKGGNYGWNVTEGVACFGAEECPDESQRGRELIDPVIAYSHDTGRSVIGGHFYTGDAVPALQDRYVFADYDGEVFAARPPEDGSRLWPITVLDAEFDGAPVAFGRGRGGELYLLVQGGSVYRIGEA